MKQLSDPPKTLIVGPAHPAVGGIATIVESLRGAVRETGGIAILNSAKRNSRLMRAVQTFVIPMQIFVRIIFNGYPRVMMFVSAYMSFWEKCAWSLVVRAAGSRAVLVMVDGNFPEFYGKLTGSKKRLAQKIVDGVECLLVQSLTWKRYYESVFENTSIRVISGGVDTKFFVPPAEAKAGNPSCILYVGWVIEAKGILDLLKAAASMVKHDIDFLLQIVGPAFGREGVFNDCAARLGIADRVEFVGSVVDRHIIRALYQSADIFAFPSHYEGFPVALLEAMSSGLPCVASSVGGVVDMLDHGRCGILVQPSSPESLATEIMNLVGNPDLRKEFGNKARQQVLKYHSLEKCTQDYMQVLCGEI